jgi:hypothetical protein
MSITEPVTADFGLITITTWTDREGISINVAVGGRRNGALSATYLHEDRAAAAAWYRHIRDAGTAGTPIWQLEAEMSALIDAGRATDADRELIADINATMGATLADHRAEQAATAAHVAAVMAPTRKVRNTRTHVFRKPLSDPQAAAIRGHRGGIVHLGNGVTRPMLTALADKGYGDLNHLPGAGLRKLPVSLTLNARGLAAATA